MYRNPTAYKEVWNAQLMQILLQINRKELYPSFTANKEVQKSLLYPNPTRECLSPAVPKSYCIQILLLIKKQGQPSLAV